jgi:diguanylate cyclase (GGDEF)-like protein
MSMPRDPFSTLRETLRWRVALMLSVVIIVLMIALGLLNTHLGLADTAFLAWAVLAIVSGTLLAMLALPRNFGSALFFGVIASALVAVIAYGFYHQRPMQHWAYVFPPVIAFLLRSGPALLTMLLYGVYASIIGSTQMPMIDVVRFASGYGLLACFLYTYALLEERAATLLRYHSDHDALSDCLNRRTFNETLASIDREHERCSFLLIDIDHFKSINDQRGHLFGDRIITEVAAVLMANIPEGARLYRYGGEEFAVILFQSNTELGLPLAERLREAVAHTDFHDLKVSVSIGVAHWNLSQGAATNALGAADSALYTAKQAGRNQVVCAATVESSAARVAAVGAPYPGHNRR